MDKLDQATLTADERRQRLRVAALRHRQRTGKGPELSETERALVGAVMHQRRELHPDTEALLAKLVERWPGMADKVESLRFLPDQVARDKAAQWLAKGIPVEQPLLPGTPRRLTYPRKAKGADDCRECRGHGLVLWEKLDEHGRRLTYATPCAMDH